MVHASSSDTRSRRKARAAPLHRAVLLASAAIALVPCGPGARAQPLLTQTSPAHGGTTCTLTITGALPGAPLYLGVSESRLDPPLALGAAGTLHLGNPIAVLPAGMANGFGAQSLSFPLPPDPALAGLLLHLQALDGGAGQLSNARAAHFGPPEILDSANPQGGILGGSFG